MQRLARNGAGEAEKHGTEVHTSPTDSPSSSETSGAELLGGATEASRPAFATEGLDDFYKPIDTHEGRHRWDPTFEWEPKEEKRIVRKLDLKICSWVCLAFFALQLDRGNITQVLAGNMLQDLKMNTNDYNTGQTIFYICFLFAELPSQMISKRLGPDRWIPVQMVSWSLIASMQAFLSGRSSFWLCRALLGIWEGGFIPDCVLYLSYYYKGDELPGRLSMFWVSYYITYIVSAFLAYGILHMDGINGLAGWRWIFALEGTLTGVIGIATYFYLPPSPCQTASWFRGKNGWFSEHEEKIMVNRVLRDDPSKGDMHNRQAVNLKLLWHALRDFDMWPIYLMGLSWLLVFQNFQQYLTLILRSDGFDSFETSLLTIPTYALNIVNLLFWCWLSEKINERFLLATVTQFWCLPLLITLEVLPAGNAGHLRWARYACTVLLAAAPYVHPMIVAITSRNAGSVRTRTVASALYNMCVQAGNVISSNIYRDKDKPYYRTGNKVLLALVAYNILGWVLTKFYYLARNAQKEKIWNAMSQEEKEHYLATTKDEGNRRLDFRFAH